MALTLRLSNEILQKLCVTFNQFLYVAFTILHHTILHHTILQCTIPYYTAPYCTILHQTAQQHTTLTHDGINNIRKMQMKRLSALSPATLWPSPSSARCHSHSISSPVIASFINYLFGHATSISHTIPSFNVTLYLFTLSR